MEYEVCEVKLGGTVSLGRGCILCDGDMAGCFGRLWQDFTYQGRI